MSTYLVAYTINDFEYRESNVNDVIFRIWARPEAIAQVEYARDIGPKVLKYFENTFKVEFPLPKMDMIAIPDFSAGAMENWGKITRHRTCRDVTAADGVDGVALTVSGLVLNSPQV